MKRLLLIALFATSASAHPGVGVVVDSRGNIFYTDLEQVWRIAPNGATGVAVPNVHTHELYLDAHDNLYGEHLWYNGEKLNTWGSRVWRRSPDGRVVDVVPAHAGFNDNFSFLRDHAGNSYFARRDKNSIEKCSATCTTLARAPFHDIRWMTVTANGTVYLIDVVDLVRITPDGRVMTIARDLSAKRDRHQVMGVWTDANENVYVADYAGRAVKRVNHRGEVSVVERSSFPWAPSGGMFARNGDMLVLETMIGPGTRARVRRVRLSRAAGAP